PGRGAAIGHAWRAPARPANAAALRLFVSPLAPRPPPPRAPGGAAGAGDDSVLPRPEPVPAPGRMATRHGGHGMPATATRRGRRTGPPPFPPPSGAPAGPVSARPGRNSRPAP